MCRSALRPRTHGELWQKIEAFPLDDPGARFTFSQKLARENHWSPAYALRVIHEYRRFVLLAVTADHPVSPSHAVDQAWHLHLTYTRSYWKGLCRDVLGRPLHHEPSRGGPEESAKFTEWYARTLASYRATFAEEPPADIWPPSGSFAHPRLRRINLDRVWAFPKPRHLAWTASAASLALAVLLTGGCRPVGEWGSALLDLPGPAFLVVVFNFWITCFGAALFLRHYFWRAPGGSLPVDALPADPYWHACLSGDVARAATTAASTLAVRKHLSISRNKKVVTLNAKNAPGVPSDAHPIERDLAAHVRKQGTLPFSDAVARVGQTCAPILADLEARGLTLTPSAASRARWRPFLIALIPVALGVAKIGVGIQRGKPVAWLIMLCAFAIGLAFICFFRPVRLTRRGRRALSATQKHHRDLKSPSGRNDALLPLSIALFGPAVLASYGFPALGQTLRPLHDNPNNTGCGSTCGGGDGGGDAGGCGGCGGGD